MSDPNMLESKLGVIFKEPAILQQALVHRSYLNENYHFPLSSNERLEFLGDALIGLVVAEELYNNFSQMAEGNLTRLRSALVRDETLAQVSQSLNLGEYLYLGRGEENSGGRHRQRNLACVFEAVAGAVFVDQGFTVAKKFVLRALNSKLEKILRGEEIDKNYKSELQEIVQKELRVTPVYCIVDSRGPDHDRVFTVEVVAGEKVIGTGSGKSKQSAEQNAARVALENL
jgi:ribonuclease-3